jgi:hypothetical protein
MNYGKPVSAVKLQYMRWREIGPVRASGEIPLLGNKLMIAVSRPGSKKNPNGIPRSGFGYIADHSAFLRVKDIAFYE